MTLTTPRFARVLLPVLALAAAGPLAAQEAERVPGNRYLVVNATDAPLACKYRVNTTTAGSMGTRWHDTDAIAVGQAFTHTAEAPGETVSLDCDGSKVTVRPGTRYQATRGSDGKVSVAR